MPGKESRGHGRRPAVLGWEKGACPLAEASLSTYHNAFSPQDSCLMSCRAVTSTATEGPIVEVTYKLRQ